MLLSVKYKVILNNKGEYKMVEFFETTLNTLMTSDVQDTCDLIPTLIWHEINLGPTWKFVFRNAVEETDMLVGHAGDTICVPYLTRTAGLTAQSITEAALDSSGYNKHKIAVNQIEITIGDIIYLATRISDVLREDQPDLNWIRASLQKMAQAIWYRLDTDLRDMFVACAGTVNGATTAGTLAYDDVVDAVAVLKGAGYWADDGTYMLFIHANQEADLVKDTRFTDTARYSYSNIPMGAGGGAGFNMPERGRYASCQVFVTDIPMNWAGIAYALVIAPPSNRYGPAAMLAWKRHLKQETWRDEQNGRDLWLLSCRYGYSCKFVDAVILISDC